MTHSARQLLAAVGGDRLSEVETLLQRTPVNTVATRRRIAEYLIQV